MKKPHLVIDHFYRVLPPEAFEEAKAFLNFFPDCEHRRNVTNYGTWEGIYIYTASGVYIELMREDEYWKPHFVAMCVSQFGDENQLHAQLIATSPTQTFTKSEINRPDGSPWLWCSMADLPGDDVFFYAEEYRDDERSKRKEIGKATGNWMYSVDSLECLATEQQLLKIPEAAKWFASFVKSTPKKTELTIPQRDGTWFNASIVPAGSPRRPFKIHGTYDKNATTPTPLPRLKHFLLTFKSGKYCIQFLETPRA
jgi:hypothetical protein